MKKPLYEKLQTLRKEHNLSQEELAEKLNLSRQTISKWERAESLPDSNNLVSLAMLYNISLDELLDLTPTKETNKEENKEIKNKSYNASGAITLILSIISFLLLGFLFKLWYIAWILFLFIPINVSLENAIKEKNPKKFEIAILICAIYVFLGLNPDIKLWHPTWILFFLIPIYHIICDIFFKEKTINKR